MYRMTTLTSSTISLRMINRQLLHSLRRSLLHTFLAKPPCNKLIFRLTSQAVGSQSKRINTATPQLRLLSGIIKEPLESLGDSITSAVLLSWSKKPGDAVKEDDVIGIVETDKVTMDIRAKKSGVFVEGLTAPGSEITVGSPLYTIDTAATESSAAANAPPAPAPAVSPSPSSAPPAPPAAAATSPAASSQAHEPADTEVQKPAPNSKKITVPVPVMGESITQGLLAKWTVKTGDTVAVDAVVATIETDKVTVDVRSPSAGVINELLVHEGSDVNVGSPLFSMTEGSGPGAGAAQKSSAAAPTSTKAAAPSTTPSTTPSPAPSGAPAPAAAKPVAAPATAHAKPTSASAPSATAGSVTPSITNDRTETRVKMTRMRQRIAQRLKEAQNAAAMLTTFQEVDMSNLMALRNKYKEDFERVHGIKLGFMSAFVKVPSTNIARVLCDLNHQQQASTATLLEQPSVNGAIDDATQEIVYRNYIDISVAVASPTGLVVPVLRNTQNMSFADIEKAIADYGNNAKKGALALEDMAGGTFTITNGGVFGSLFSTPMINPPQSAILGMHATKMRAVVVDGKIEARPMMYLALTYDHRLIDGREAVIFLKSVANKIEDPAKMLLSL